MISVVASESGAIAREFVGDPSASGHGGKWGLGG